MSEVSPGLITGIVRVLKPNGETAGTGFVIAQDGLIATCSHVVQDDESQKRSKPRPEKVTVVFRATGEPREAWVEPNWWRPSNANDVAILRIEGSLPAQVKPLLLGSSSGTEHHPFDTFGFPADNPKQGIWGDGHILAETKIQDVQVLQLSSSQVTPGFSGAPILDRLRRRVVGIVTSIMAPDSYGRQTKTAFITPTEILRAIYPALEVSDICPYRKLLTFTEDDAEFFFGRQRVIDELVNSLKKEPRFLTVLGPSGSGKSSVVQAGLIPAIRSGKVPGSDRWRHIVVIRPTDQSFRSKLNQPGQGMQEHTVVVIDQFEELFTSPGEMYQEIAEQLLRLLETSSHITLIIVMRIDFLNSFTTQESLAQRLMTRHVFVWPKFEDEEVAEIIRKPAQYAGFGFEEGLVETIVKEVKGRDGGEGGSSISLPLLEFALTELWERHRDGVMTHEAYRVMGGVTGALTKWANDAFIAFDPLLRSQVRRIFTNLVHLGDEKQRIPDSRRRRDLTSLYPSKTGQVEIDERAWAEVEEIVRRLVQARLLVKDQDKQSEKETVEIIHDSLIQVWGQLKQWLDEDRPFLHWHQNLEARVREWVATSVDDPSQRGTYKLYREKDLEEAIERLIGPRANLSQAEQDFIQASREQEKREKQQLEELYEEAQLQRKIAFARQLAAQAELIRNYQPQLSLLLAVESIRLFHCVETDQAVRNGLTHIGCLTNSLKHNGIIHAIAVSPDGHRIATGSSDKRAIIWDITDSQTTDTPPNIILPSDDQVHLVTFSPDGQYLATASDDKRVRVWDITGKRTRILATLPHSSSVNAIAFSPDGLYLATAGNDPVAKIWEWRMETLRFKLPHNSNINSLIFSHDGNYLATASDDCTAKVWETTAWRLHHLLEHTDMVLAVAFTHDSRHLATASWDHSAAVWETSSGKQINRFRHVSEVSTVTFSPDGRYLATTSNKVALVWNTIKGYVVAYLPHSGKVNAVGFSPNSLTLVTAGDDRAARIWEIASSHQLARFDHPSIVRTATFTSDGSKVVTASHDSEARTWKIGRGDQYLCLVHRGGVNAVTFASTGTYIATASDDRTARLWDATTGKEIRSIPHSERVNAVVFSRDGRYLATASDDCTARVLQIPDGDEDFSLHIDHTDKVNAVAFSRDGRYIATASSDGRAGLLSLAGDNHPKYLLHGLSVNSITFSPDERLVATASTDGHAYIWSVSDNSYRKLRHSGEVLTAVFSADGRYLVTASGDRMVWLWNVDNMSSESMYCLPIEDITKTITLSPDERNLVAIGGRGPQRGVWSMCGTAPIRHFGLTYEESATAIAFSTSGINTKSEYLATGHGDGTAIIWQITDGRQLARVTHKHKCEVKSVTFSPCGRYVATASADRTAIIWLWRPEDLIEVARSRVNGNLTEEEWQQYLPGEPYCKRFLDLP
jgi:WD40 repeat protein